MMRRSLMPALVTAIGNVVKPMLAISSSPTLRAVISCGVPWKWIASNVYDLSRCFASPGVLNNIVAQLATGTMNDMRIFTSSACAEAKFALANNAAPIIDLNRIASSLVFVVAMIGEDAARVNALVLTQRRRMG